MALWCFTTLHNNLKQIFSTSIKSLSQCTEEGKQHKCSSGFWLGYKLLTGQSKKWVVPGARGRGAGFLRARSCERAASGPRRAAEGLQPFAYAGLEPIFPGPD